MGTTIYGQAAPTVESPLTSLVAERNSMAPIAQSPARITLTLEHLPFIALSSLLR